MLDLMPLPRVCAVCLQSPCACPDFADEADDQGAQEEQDFINSLMAAMDAGRATSERLRAGGVVLVVDDATDPPQASLVCAAVRVSPAAVNFLATHGRGLVCLTLARERMRQLGVRRYDMHGLAEGAASCAIGAAGVAGSVFEHEHGGIGHGVLLEGATALRAAPSASGSADRR